MNPVVVTRGASPVILAFPHTGTDVPGAIMGRLNVEGKKLRDTDWHVDRLYDGLLAEATTVRATFHRYVIDANRDPSGKSLYPGQNTTSLVPMTDFDDRPIWNEGMEPDGAALEDTLKRFHAPYHAALQAEVERVRAAHGVAVLYDCHSIRSMCPFLFEGRLPDFNIGTDNGRTCAPGIERRVAEICGAAEGYSSVVNGRFRGGWTTRHYGNPAGGVHEMQMELAQSAYLTDEAPPWDYDDTRAERLRTPLRAILEAVAAGAGALSAAAR